MFLPEVQKKNCLWNEIGNPIIGHYREQHFTDIAQEFLLKIQACHILPLCSELNANATK